MAAGFWRKLVITTPGDQEDLSEKELTELKSAGHVRRHYVISGRVQGVGFRYAVFYLAEELGLSGWVSNLKDGCVEMELQGLPESIDMLLYRLENHDRIVLESVNAEEMPLQWAGRFQVHS